MGSKEGTKLRMPFCRICRRTYQSTVQLYTGAVPQLHKRYIDDVVGNACHSHIELEQYIAFVSNFHPALQFTHTFSENELPFLDINPRISFISFTCLSTGLIYCISCGRCPANYIGKTGRTLRERLGEHLRSINKNALGFPVAELFSSNQHTVADALVRRSKLCSGYKQRKRKEMHLISGHASRVASMPIFTSFEVHARVQNATFKFKIQYLESWCNS